MCSRCKQAGHWKENCALRWKEHSAADGKSEHDTSLVVDEEAREVGDEIAEALDEAHPEAISTMARAVQLLGEEVARTLLVQTWQVEEGGGLLTTDGTNRRRTAGGVFLWLVKQRLPDEAQRNLVFLPRAQPTTHGRHGTRSERAPEGE